MEEERLLQIALIVAFSGLTLLYGISLFVPVEKGALIEEDLDKVMVVRGEVSGLVVGEEVSTFFIWYEEKAKVVVFDKLDEVEEGMEVMVEGKVMKDRNGGLQVNGERVERVEGGNNNQLTATEVIIG